MNKIVIVTNNMGAGGAERVIAQLVNYFTNSNIECFIIQLSKGEVFYTLDSKVTVNSIGKKSNNSLINKIKTFKELRKKITLIKPDVVLAMPEEVGIYTLPALFNTKIPVVVSERNDPKVMPWKKISRVCRVIFYPLASGFVFQTNQAANFFPDRIKSKGVILPNPLDLNRIPELKFKTRSKEIVGAGRLDIQKNFYQLIKSFKKFHEKHQDYVLKIYGEGPLREELIDYAMSVLPEGTFEFPGQDPNLLQSMCDSKMFILSSKYEGMPNILIEAMAMGMPVISTNCPSGGPMELIENEKNGLLVEVDDIEAMSQAMEMIAESEDLANELGRNAIKIREQLDANIIAEKWMTYLKSIVLRKS